MTTYEVWPRDNDTLDIVGDPLAQVAKITHAENDLAPDTIVIEGEADGLDAILDPSRGVVATEASVPDVDGRQTIRQVFEGAVGGTVLEEAEDNGRLTQKATVTLLSGYRDVARRLGLPAPSQPIGSTVTTFGADVFTATGPAEDVLLELIDVAIGPGALADRRSGLVLPASAHRGPDRTVSVRNDALWTVVQPLAEAAGLALRTRRVAAPGSAQRVLDVLDAPNVSAGVAFGDASAAVLGRLTGWRYELTAPTGNVFYVAGGGEAADRQVLLVSDPDSVALWGRIEGPLVDQRQVATDAVDVLEQLTAAGTDALTQAVGTATVTASVDDTPDGVDTDGRPLFGTQYRRDWALGWSVGVFLPRLPAAYSVQRVRQVVTTTDGLTVTGPRKIVLGSLDAGMSVSQRLLVGALRSTARERGSR